MEIKHNIIGWIEVPVSDMDRAIRFYETVFGFELSRNKMGPLDMAWFPYLDNSMGSGGSLVCHPDYYKPSTNGALVYFTAFSGDLSNELSRVENAGGKILSPRKLIADGFGYMALFLDTEGNRVAIHSRE